MASPSDSVFFTDLPADSTEASVKTTFSAYGTPGTVKVLPARTPTAKRVAIVKFASTEEASWIVENLNGNLPEGIDEPIKASFAKPQTAPMAPIASFGKGAMGGKGAIAPGGKGQSWAVERPSPYGVVGKAGGKMSWGGEGGKGSSKGQGSIKDVLRIVGQSGTQPGFEKGTVPLENQVYLRSLPRDTTNEDLFKLCSPFGALASRGVSIMTQPDGACKGSGFADFIDAAAAQVCVDSLNGVEFGEGQALLVTIKQGSNRAEKGAGKVGAAPGACRIFTQTGECKFGETCKFSH